MSKAPLFLLALPLLSSCGPWEDPATIERKTALRGGESAAEWLRRFPACPPGPAAAEPDVKEGFLAPTAIQPNVHLNCQRGAACCSRIPNPTQEYSIHAMDGTETIVRFSGPPLPPVELFECQWPHAINVMHQTPVRVRIADVGGAAFGVAEVCRLPTAPPR